MLIVQCHVVRRMEKVAPKSHLNQYVVAGKVLGEGSSQVPSEQIIVAGKVLLYDQHHLE